MCGQGAVYIRSLVNLDASLSEDELLFSPLCDTDGQSYHSESNLPEVINTRSADLVTHSTSPAHTYTLPFPQEFMCTDMTNDPYVNASRTSINLNDAPFPDNASQASTVMLSDNELKSVIIHRATLKEDVIRIFADPSILTYDLNFTIIDNRGREEEGKGIGVSREVVSSFWTEVYNSFTLGLHEKVPAIRHDLQMREWEAIARVLIYSHQVEYLPSKLCVAFLASTLFGEGAVSAEILLMSFKNYIALDEKAVLEQCFAEAFDTNDDDLLDFLSAYRCFKTPSKDNVKKIIFELAHQEIIQKPRYISDCWSRIMNEHKHKLGIRNMDDLKLLIKQKEVSAKKIIKLFQSNPGNEAERETMEHLKRFVKSLDAKDLGLFLKLLTGSDVISVDLIEITYTSLQGAAHRPIFHTCGPLLELPSTYDSYSDLAEEMNNLLLNARGIFIDIV
eukprot:gene832-124_t